MYPVSCALGYGSQVLRNKLDDHLKNTCPKSVIDCLYSKFGCNVKVCAIGTRIFYYMLMQYSGDEGGYF